MEYTFEKKLCATLYGEVYRAKSSSGSIVAVKLSDLSQAQVEDPMREVTIMQKLTSQKQASKYVLKHLDTFTFRHDGIELFCSVTEFASQGDMLEKVQSLSKQKRQMSLKAAHQHFFQIAEAVNFIHQQGVSHLDLSLENVLITAQNEVRVCDFGQAAIQQHFQPQLHRRGKVRYMCPEIYDRKAYDGFKADVWSLGVILWAMVTGSLLYQQPILSDSNFRLLTKGKEGIDSLLHAGRIYDVPASLVELLAGMLHVDPENRWTMEQVLAHPWSQSRSNICDLKTSPSELPQKQPQKGGPRSSLHSLPVHCVRKRIQIPRCASDSVLYCRSLQP